jgi:hypothetical protein
MGDSHLEAAAYTGSFASRRQQRWAFANGKPFAKPWADNTNFKRLPERVKNKKQKEGNGTGELAQLVRNKSPKGGTGDLELTERDFDKGVGAHGTDRDKMPASSFAGPHRSFPIKVQKDVQDAWDLAGHAANPDAVRAKIKRIAKSKGLSAPSGSGGKKESEMPAHFGRQRFTESAFK